MTDAIWEHADKEQLARQAECFETPLWAINAILDVEVMPSLVVDPCCGRGHMGRIAKASGYDTLESDAHDWGHGHTGVDFLTDDGFFEQHLGGVKDFAVFMNPPFSKAEEFVERAIELGARKIVSFQRFAWWESEGREGFWEAFTPQRIYVCGSRATCWRIDIDPADRNSGAPTAHAWFVWERGQPIGPITGRLYNREKK